MKLKSSPKRYEGYKSRDPADTVRLLRQNFKKIRLHTIYRERKLSSEDASLFTGKLKLKEIGFSTIGKGVSSSLAKASAYAELAERYSAGLFYFSNFSYEDFYDYTIRLIERRYLKGFIEDFRENISFHDIKPYVDYLTQKQYDMFMEKGLLDRGVDAYDPLEDTYMKIPINLIDLLSGSNGLASGNTMEEAITQASCEIFERYAASKILTQEITCPTIDIDTIKSEKIRKCIDIFRRLNIDIVLKDFSLGGRIPVVATLFINRNFETDKNPIKKIFFYKMVDVGSSINLEEAILRTLTERVQEFSREKLVRYREIDRLYSTWKTKLDNDIRCGNEDFRFFSRHYILRKDLSFLEEGSIISFKDLHNEANKDFLDDCKSIFCICEQNGWDISIVDFTHKVLEFPTVRVVMKPISTSFDPFVRTLLNIFDDEKRFNSFYGIKDFYRYVNTDDWIHDRKEILMLVENVEEYLSFNLPFYKIDIDRGMFRQHVNLFGLLAELYIMLGNIKIAMIYSKLNKSILPLYHGKKNPLKIESHHKFETGRKLKILKRVVDSFF